MFFHIKFFKVRAVVKLVFYVKILIFLMLAQVVLKNFHS